MIIIWWTKFSNAYLWQNVLYLVFSYRYMIGIFWIIYVVLGFHLSDDYFYLKVQMSICRHRFILPGSNPLLEPLITQFTDAWIFNQAIFKSVIFFVSESKGKSVNRFIWVADDHEIFAQYVDLVRAIAFIKKTLHFGGWKLVSWSQHMRSSIYRRI